MTKQTDVNPFEPPVNQDHSRERQQRGMRVIGNSILLVGFLLSVLIVAMMVGLMVLSLFGQ